jgi:hypothetical protein
LIIPFKRQFCQRESKDYAIYPVYTGDGTGWSQNRYTVIQGQAIGLHRFDQCRREFQKIICETVTFRYLT